MDAAATAMREIALPVSIFGSLRSELAKEVGTLATIHGLHHAGYEAGVDAASAFGAGVGGDVASMGQSAFWARLSEFFARRGWGTLTQNVESAGVGLLCTPDWAEASSEAIDPEASCCLSTGFLSGLLSELADGRVAVLEVRCRGRGDEQCQFAFGSEVAIHELYGHLFEGTDLGQALAAL